MKTSDKKNKTFRFKDLYLPTFSLSLSGYRFILLLRKGRMLDVTAKLGKGFRGTCCKIRQNLYQDSKYFGKESRSFEAVQAYRVYCTSLLCPPDRAGLYHGTRWIKWWLQAFFLHKIMYCHHLSLPIHRGVQGKGDSSGNRIIKLCCRKVGQLETTPLYNTRYLLFSFSG